MFLLTMRKMSRLLTSKLYAVREKESVIKNSDSILEPRRTSMLGTNPDILDALTCALIALLFVNMRKELCSPPGAMRQSEAWI